MPLLYEQVTGRVPIEHVGLDDWAVVLPIEQTSIFNPFNTLKRLIDIGVSAMGVIGFGLLLPFIALAIWLESPGPIFYSQERVGKGGRVFHILKLRSMETDAEKEGPQWATKGDARVTRVGKILRKTRLDELPQFVNILRGDMSLVGPRPERPFFVDQLAEEIPFYRTRHVVRPGATGWAQIRYPYGSTIQDALMKLQYDLYYIRHQSLALDLLIMVRTIGKMLSFAGT
jgi:exopolysaccharide biosynthesis polyprenyl glycosylphosphotransferase